MNIKITADSTCDLPAELLKKHGITLAPLHIVKDGAAFTDGVDITPDDIFAHVDAGGALCSTAAVSVGEYLDLFGPLSREHDAVVHITIGDGFSSCYSNACIAAGEFQNVRVVDSKNLSMGQGQVVLEACRLAEEGCGDIDALCESLRSLTGRIESCFLLDRLDYLAKGGRCSSIVALGANLLRLKPSIEVVDGAMRVSKKYRGTYQKCMAEFVQDRLTGRDDIERGRLLAPFTSQLGDNLHAFRRAVRAGKFKQVVHAPAGCTISCHCGPRTVGLMFIRKEK